MVIPKPVRREAHGHTPRKARHGQRSMDKCVGERRFDSAPWYDFSIIVLFHIAPPVKAARVPALKAVKVAQGSKNDRPPRDGYASRIYA